MALTREEALPRIIELIAPFNRKDIAVSADTSFANDLELDSLTVMDLVAAFEDEYDIILPLNMLPELETVGQVTDAIVTIKNR